MNVARSRLLRKLWMQLDERATRAKRNIGRNVLTNSDDFWTRRARRWTYWAEVAHWYLKQEVGLITDEHSTQTKTRHDIVDTNERQQPEQRRQSTAKYASAGSAAIVGSGWDIDTEGAYGNAGL